MSDKWILRETAEYTRHNFVVEWFAIILIDELCSVSYGGEPLMVDKTPYDAQHMPDVVRFY